MKILIRLPNWLGDVVMSIPFVGAVKQVYPGALVDVIIKKELSSIAALVNGVNNIYPFAKQEHKGLAGAYKFGKNLKNENYDLFFNLPSSLSSCVLAWATGAKKRIGFKKEGSFFLTNKYNPPEHAHRVDEYISLLEHFSGKIVSQKSVRPDIGQITAVDKQRILINFNSEATSRRMPLTKGRSILNLLTISFKTSTFTLIGSPKEAAFIDELLAGATHADRLENYAGKTDLPGLARLMASSAVILTTDSGPAHLANSVGTPTVVMFGAGDENNTAPYNKQNLNVLRYGRLSCEPCLNNKCELYGVPKCMELLDELQIINTLRVYLPNA